MIRKALIALGITALACGSAEAQKLEYDCDTQAEHYSVLKAVQPGPRYVAGGTISLRDIFAVKKYVTTGMLEFEPADGSWRVRIGLVALKAGKDAVVMGQLEIKRGGKAEEPKTIGDVLEFSPGKDYPIGLDLGPDGGTATLGGHKVAIDTGARGPVNASILCSGGEFLFKDLTLGS